MSVARGLGTVKKFEEDEQQRIEELNEANSAVTYAGPKVPVQQVQRRLVRMNEDTNDALFTYIKGKPAHTLHTYTHTHT